MKAFDALHERLVRPQVAVTWIVALVVIVCVVTWRGYEMHLRWGEDRTLDLSRPPR